MEVKVRCPHCKQSNKLRADSKNPLTCFHCRKNIQLSTIGNYWVLEELGAGGFGRVYRGYEPSLDREVAIKVLHSNIGSSADGVTRFKREAVLTARINHPHVAPVYSHGQMGEQLYLVSALITGKELKHYITNQGFPDIAQAVTYAITLLETLHDVHAGYNTWHRDVKPSNIMISDRGVIYLLDFGIAASMDPDLPKLTQSGSPLGTPYYMPPEQVRMEQSEDIGHWSDQYSMGVVLYQMLTGRMPFDSDNVPEIYRKILQTNPPSLSRLRPEINGELQAIVFKALEKNPSHRFSNCQEFAEALRTWIGRQQQGNLPLANPVSGGSNALWKILAIVITMAFVVLVGFLIFSPGRNSSGPTVPLNPNSDKYKIDENWNKHKTNPNN